MLLTRLNRKGKYLLIYAELFILHHDCTLRWAVAWALVHEVALSMLGVVVDSSGSLWQISELVQIRQHSDKHTQGFYSFK